MTATASTPATVKPGHDEPEAIGHAGGERVAAGQLDQRAVGGADPVQRRLLGAERDELGRAAEQFDELGRELSARGRLTAARPGPERSRQRGHRHAGREQTGGEYETGSGQEHGRGEDRDATGQERDEWRLETAKVQVLERVDVRDHPGQQVALAVALELCRR